MVIYDLGPLAETAPARSSSMALEVRAPLWFDSMGIHYRLAYAEPARLREYARARWAGPPAQLIQLRLQRELAVEQAGQSRTLCLLRLEIDEFSQVFTTPSDSHAVLQGRALWLDRGRNRLAERQINIERHAASGNSSGGVAALTASVAELGRQIVTWENELGRDGLLRSCQP
jgi:ABC-type uncharacterized transport system auxiliary subunit